MLNIVGITAVKSASVLFCEGVTTVVTIYGIYHASKIKRKPRQNSRNKQANAR